MVVAGNYKGATGQVLEALPREGRVVIDGVNMRKRHQAPSQQNPEGGIVTFEAPIAASNVMLVCPHCDQPARASGCASGARTRSRPPSRNGRRGSQETERRLMEKARLRKHYDETVRPRLADVFGFENPHQIPRLEKIVINAGLGDAKDDPKLLESVVNELTRISGQRPVVTRARKSISNFNLREGMPIGVKVTMRDTRMYEFLDRFVSTAVPRIRDFRGFNSRSFDGRGNYTVGVKEQMVFTEVDYDEIVRIHGMDITFVTSTDKDDEALVLLREMGMPFRGETPVVV
jgi:large subunit ribosomal protein L5